MTPATNTPLRVKLARDRAGLDLDQVLLLVRDPTIDGSVRLRWRYSTRPNVTWLYRCSACGPQTVASCPHAYAAALFLAERHLGIQPATHRTGGHTP